jgi:hypothetical protein
MLIRARMRTAKICLLLAGLCIPGSLRAQVHPLDTAQTDRFRLARLPESRTILGCFVLLGTIAKYEAHFGFPPIELDSLLTLPPENPHLDPKEWWLYDGWKRRYVYAIAGDSVILRSKGSDGIIESPDDIVCRPRQGAPASAATPAPAHSPAPGCRSETFSGVEHQAQVIRQLVSATSRTTWRLPYIADTSEVHFVQDTTLCRTAAIELAKLQGDDTLTAPPVYLLRVGPTRFVAFNYHKVGQWYVFAIFDESFRHVINVFG